MIKQEIIHAEIIDTECADTRRIGAELEIWKKVEDMLALKGNTLMRFMLISW